MYSWIWQRIPFKQWQLKALVSGVLVLGVGALLWYQVFPAVEPILPFDDVQVETNDPGADITVESPGPSTAPSKPPAATSVPTGTKPPAVLPS
ncbi:hypothetical protein Dvina_00310 [Dactylosporangium vinaceum]|uniref:Uncharacterized protein n=1 Tax=Dactylosporangium vinaceum TaxID=53362 RepID=A0ABV5MPL1_9ACTN|nr:hypothetical protein [Dactylosporangium vinaceum]UAB96729.1 hypothetical protein Dvina_00310 [Dactylosporangium vinaceum]